MFSYNTNVSNTMLHGDGKEIIKVEEDERPPTPP
jgi:hypothetical protein